MQRADGNTFSGRVAKFADLVFGKLLLILQMPKTGSQTIEASLAQCRLPHRIIRCHYLSAARQARFRQSIHAHQSLNEWKRLAQDQMDQMLTLRTAIRLRRVMRALRIQIPKVELITAVRDPISIALSSIFENHSLFVASPRMLTPERCGELLLSPTMLTSIENWFDVELKPITGIDVYKTPFPRKQGYAIYETRSARVLLYKIEALGQLQPMMKQFLGCEIPQILKRNMAEDKLYAEIYHDTRSHLSLPIQFVHARYTHKFARQFYSPRELAAFFRHWTRSESADLTLMSKPQCSSVGEQTACVEARPDCQEFGVGRDRGVSSCRTTKGTVNPCDTIENTSAP